MPNAGPAGPLHGPYEREDTVHTRRVRSLKQLAQTNPEHHRNILAVLDLFDRATARGNAVDVQQYGAALVACWEAAAAALGQVPSAQALRPSRIKSGIDIGTAGAG